MTSRTGSILAAVVLVTAVTATPALARDVATACDKVDAIGTAECTLKRGSHDWQLTTAVLVGGGAKSRVAEVERSFCREANARQVPARVVRWNRMPGPAAPAAKLEWTCGTPAVSTGPVR